MKKINIYIAALLALPILSACSDWLDGGIPKDKNLEDAQYATEEGIDAVLNGLYTNLASPTLYGGKLTSTDIEMMAHYYYYGDGTEKYNGFANTAGYKYSEDNVKKSLADIWKNAYEHIYRINRFIGRLEGIDNEVLIPEKHKTVYLGEAYAMRAMVQLDIFRLFGDLRNSRLIPYNQTDKVALHEGVPSAEYCKLLMEDLEKARTLLEKDPIRTDGIKEIQGNDAAGGVPVKERFFLYSRNCRLNYYAATALEARTLLYFGKTAEDGRTAESIAQSVLDEAFGEDANAKKPFYWVDRTTVADPQVANYILYSEVMFGIQNIDMYKLWEGRVGGNQPGSVYGVNMPNLKENIYRNDDVNSTDFAQWDDVRAKQWTSSRQNGVYVSNKFSELPGRKKEYTPINTLQPLIRTAELFLIIAERKLPTTADAVTALNAFRAKRGIQTVSNIAPDATDEKIYDVLQTEYYKEFYGEGQAFFFMKRRGATEIIKGTERGMMAIPADSYLPPIPQAETEN